MYYKIHLDTKKWKRVTKCIVEYSLAVVCVCVRERERERDHSIEFVQVKPSILKFLVF
jgi:hypothetical protein